MTVSPDLGVLSAEAVAGSRPGSLSGISVAVLSKDGRLVYAALGARGLIAVYDAASLRVHDVIKVRLLAGIKSRGTTSGLAAEFTQGLCKRHDDEPLIQVLRGLMC